jgi:hypothetical protein
VGKDRGGRGDLESCGGEGGSGGRWLLLVLARVVIIEAGEELGKEREVSEERGEEGRIGRGEEGEGALCVDEKDAAKWGLNVST